MKKLTALLILTTVWLAVSNCENSSKQVQLKFKYQTGMNLTYDHLTKGTILAYNNDTTFRNRAVEIKMKLILDVLNITADSLFEISENKTYQYTSLNLIDSNLTDKTETGPEVVLYMGKNGRIHDLAYTDESMKSDNSYLKNYYDQGMPVFPDKSIGQGYSWTQSYKVILEEEELNASTTYSVKAFARERGYDCILIEYDGNLIIPIDINPSDSTERQGIDRISSTGVLYFAYKEGFVVLQKERWLLDGDRKWKPSSTEEFINSKVAIEYDVEYALKDKSYQ